MESLLNDAFGLLRTANDLEERNDKVEAATKYYEATYLMRRYLQRLPPTTNTQTKDLVQQKVSHYQTHAASLLRSAEPHQPSSKNNPRSPLSRDGFFHEQTPARPISSPSPQIPKSTSSAINTIAERAGRANTCLSRALDFDESGNKEAAINQYMSAAESYLEAIRVAEQASQTESVLNLLKRRLNSALDRTEELKSPSRTVVRENRTGEPGHQKSGSSLTEGEILVLKRSSLIASGVFLPFSEQDALQLSLEASKPTSALFKDKDGLLKLSAKQKGRFFKWARPSEIARIRRQFNGASESPTMVKTITPYTIRQQFVTDCSFIASLCICAAFERRFHKKLVTSIVYPQVNGMPIISQTGKYLVKLWLNGVARQVVVDDLLPIDRYGNLLCSQTTQSGLELWVSIIEKAYMKLCGGYDFPGSNSGVDLFSLTGWIPERIFFPKDLRKVKDHETPPERAWERLHSASSFGDCLITVSSTSDIPKERADAVGLVTGHAYAVLSVLQTRNGTRLLQLKNPWAHKSWRGRFSPFDSQSWADRTLCAEVGYDPVEARKHDDGVFWICWDDILVYFQNLHLSWNPSLFPYHITTHGFWPKDQGPTNDTFNVGENPQYILTPSDEAIAKKASVWILLSRHVTKQEQEGSEVTDFLTAHVHRAQKKQERVWYPGGNSCVLTGAYTNNPHVLIRYDLSDKADKELCLVLSQYQKAHDLGYSLSCYCAQPFSLGRPRPDLPVRNRIASEWTPASAGGPPGQAGFGRNPMWALRVPKSGATVQLRCSTQKTYAVNVMVVATTRLGERVQRLISQPVIDSGHYRHGFVVADTKKLQPGTYTIIASTFNPEQTGSFLLDVFSSTKMSLEPIQGLGE